MKHVEVVENGANINEAVNQFADKGFEKNEVYVFTYDKENSKNLTKVTDTNIIRLSEEGPLHSAASLFLTREDELRTKMASLGLSKDETKKYEEELKKGSAIVVAATGERKDV
ncbi:general stress protein [Priestia megaterium]|uniref:general stress protein n=1 Tax=Priestia megaterium TaxID=1404 RepID=UPI002E1F4E35|nr:general stress protein [Priestia megaterium]